MLSREKRPVFSGGTVEALSWNIWDWASHEWASLNVYGPGFEGCRVWTMRSKSRESKHAERMSRVWDAQHPALVLDGFLAPGPAPRRAQ